MKTEEEIKRELKLSDQYYKLVRDTRIIHSHYYAAGYKTALEVVLGLRESEVLKHIREFVDFDLFREVLESEEV